MHTGGLLIVFEYMLFVKDVLAADGLEDVLVWRGLGAGCLRNLDRMVSIAARVLQSSA